MYWYRFDRTKMTVRNLAIWRMLYMKINYFLNDLKREQALYLDYQKAESTLKSLVKFTQGSKEMMELLNLETQKILSKLLEKMELEIKSIYEVNKTIICEYRTLRDKLNSGNLRNVVSELIAGEGMTFQRFAKEIGYSEQHIIALIKDGIVSMNLLDAICEFFDINKTNDFIKYVQIH